MKRILIFPVGLLTLLGSACSISPKAPPVLSLVKDDYSLAIGYLEKYVPAQMKKHRLTGVSVALVDDQRVVWSGGFGFADKSAKRPASASTVYRAGSVSKLFTALAVMQLAEEQQLNLDAPIRDSVPEFNLKTRFGSIDRITLRNILAHHAGIPGNLVDGMWTNEPESFKSVTSRLSRYYAAFPPDRLFAYSNAGYSVAGHAIENASAMPFVDYMHDSLLRPLGMDHSNFAFDTTGDEVARSYANGKQIEELGLRDLPAGGLVTTVGDLSNLVKLVNANGRYPSQLLSPEALQEMLAVQKHDPVYEPSAFNGIGWFHFSRFLDDKYTVVGHTGQTMAHSSIVSIAPDIKLGVVLLSNTQSNGALEQMTDEILRVAHAVKTHKPLYAVADAEEKLAPLPGVETGLAGQYVSRFGYVDITQSGDQYNVLLGGNKMKFSRDDKGGYALRARLLGFIPVKPPGLGDLSFHPREVSGEKFIYAQEPGGQSELVATQVRPQERNAAWDARLGDYALTNPVQTEVALFQVEDVKLVYADGVYQFSLKSPLSNQQLPLTVINDTEASLQGYGRGLGETLFGQADGTLLYAGLLFEKKP